MKHRQPTTSRMPLADCEVCRGLVVQWTIPRRSPTHQPKAQPKPQPEAWFQWLWP